MASDLDVLVVGSGVAGLSLAVRLAGSSARVGVLTKAELSQSTTRWAQGGVAAVLGGDEDSVDLHHADTLAAGAGLCDPRAVGLLVGEGPGRVHELVALGAEFDREAGGRFALAREGGHSTARVVHAGGAATGAEVERALVAALRRSAAAVLEHWFALDLEVDGGRCTGVVARDRDGSVRLVSARQVVVATGGVGQLYAVTTNPAEATGDGVAMALRRGVAVADVEFVQFHPTALHHPAMPRPLLSEALRGHGALLRDAAGDRFVDELAPRDVVSRAMADRMAAQGVDHLWLDATGLDGFDDRFPTISASVRAAGLDPAADWLPIAPAAHHVAGGICTDLDGASVLPGLWAVGEAACSGVHGANRLASNSLLEGMVFGARAAEAILAGRDGPLHAGVLAGMPATAPGETPGGTPAAGAGAGAGAGCSGGAVPVVAVDAADLPPWASGPDPASAGPAPAGGDVAGTAPADPVAGPGTDWDKWRDHVQRAMTDGAGVVRSPASLQRAALAVGAAARALDAAGDAATASSTAASELRNLVTVGWAVLRAAVARRETRGAHTRTDHPVPDERWRVRLGHGLPAGRPAR